MKGKAPQVWEAKCTGVQGTASQCSSSGCCLLPRPHTHFNDFSKRFRSSWLSGSSDSSSAASL